MEKITHPVEINCKHGVTYTQKPHKDFTKTSVEILKNCSCSICHHRPCELRKIYGTPEYEFNEWKEQKKLHADTE